MADRNNFQYVTDPIKLGRILWPDVYFYDKQREIIYSVWNDNQTFVPAGNMLGKDFVAGFICLAFFLTRQPCRIVTTSAKDDHLRVLWGEIHNFIQSSKYPLRVEQGGVLIVNQREIKKVWKGEECPKSYIKGMVAGPDSIASMQGHHVADTGDGIPRTLFVSDESSSVRNEYWEMADTWMHRALVLGNTWPCDNFFKWAVEGKPGTNDRGGDIPRPGGRPGYLRRVIHIEAEDSPNIQLARAQMKAGQEPTGEVIVPGVKSWAKYQDEMVMWDDHKKCVSHMAKFYKGADLLMYPPGWLKRAEEIAFDLEVRKVPRKAKGIGVDPAEGGDNTAMVASDEYGMLDMVTKPTADTSVIVPEVIAFMIRHGVPAERVCFDRGGGGKQHADLLRSKGYAVRTVGFGESLNLDPKRGLTLIEEKKENREERYVYVNRRAEMFGILMLLLDPSNEGWGIPRRFGKIFEQLGPIPKLYDSEGRLRLLPKHKKDPDSKELSLKDLIGHSPDEADALCLSIYAMRSKPGINEAGGF